MEETRSAESSIDAAQSTNHARRCELSSQIPAKEPELADGRTKATFRILVDPAREMPTALVNIAQQITVSQYLGNLEDRAALPCYRTTRPQLASL